MAVVKLNPLVLFHRPLDRPELMKTQPKKYEHRWVCSELQRLAEGVVSIRNGSGVELIQLGVF